jgi:hypothetical protein
MVDPANNMPRLAEDMILDYGMCGPSVWLKVNYVPDRSVMHNCFSAYHLRVFLAVASLAPSFSNFLDVPSTVSGYAMQYINSRVNFPE